MSHKNLPSALIAKQDAVALLNTLADIASVDPDLKIIVATREDGKVHCKPYAQLLGPDMYTGYDKPTVDNYACVMATVSHKDGTLGRKKDDFRAGLCLMVDDLGTGKGSKFPIELVTDILEPSAIIETSPDNYQAIYFFDKPLYDRHSFDTLIKAFIYVIFNGEDPGQDDINRIFRIPYGTNSKYESKPRVKLRKLDSNVRYSKEQLYHAFQLEKYAPEYERLMKIRIEKHERIKQRSSNCSDDELAFSEAYGEFIRHGHMRYNGELMDAGHDPHYVVDCPWWEEHSDHSDSQKIAKLFPPSDEGSQGRLYCHHSSCKARARSNSSDGYKDSYHPLDGVTRLYVKSRPSANFDWRSIYAKDKERQEQRNIAHNNYVAWFNQRQLEHVDSVMTVAQQVTQLVEHAHVEASKTTNEWHKQLISEYNSAKLKESSGAISFLSIASGEETSKEIVDTEWVWHSYIPMRTVNFLYGGSFGGKTFMAMELAHCIQNGISYMGMPTVKMGVLHVFMEGRETASLRMKAIRETKRFDDLILIGHTNNEPFEFDICPPPELSGGTLINANAMERRLAVRRFLKANDIGLVIIDTLSASADANFDENNNNSVAEYIRKVKKWALWCGVAILIIHHTGKGEGQDMRGASSMRANADGVFFLAGEKLDEDGRWVSASIKDGTPPTRRVLKCEKAKGGSKLTKIGEVGEFDIIDVEFGIDAWGLPISSAYSQQLSPETKVSKAVGRKLVETIQEKIKIEDAGNLKDHIVLAIDRLHKVHMDINSFNQTDIRIMVNIIREEIGLPEVSRTSLAKPIAQLCECGRIVRDGTKYLTQGYGKS